MFSELKNVDLFRTLGVYVNVCGNVEIELFSNPLEFVVFFYLVI